MELAPITSSELRGRARSWGRQLRVTDGAGHLVVDARLGGWAMPAFALVYTTQGQWRYEWKGGFELPGPKRRPREERARRLEVVDRSDNLVATFDGEVTIHGGETLPWAGPRLWSSLCGLGGDLWVAKGLRPRRRGFRAELSGAMLSREDCALLTGIAAVLTQWSLSRADAADLGGLAGGGLG